MPAAATPTSPPNILSDLLCNHCDYNLKTLPLNANCPECGTPVFQTFTHPKIRRRPLTISQFLLALFITCLALVALYVQVSWKIYPIARAYWMSDPFSYYAASPLAAFPAFICLIFLVAAKRPLTSRAFPARLTIILSTVYLLAALTGTAMRYADENIFPDAPKHFSANNPILAWAHLFEVIASYSRIPMMLAACWFIGALRVTSPNWNRHRIGYVLLAIAFSFGSCFLCAMRLTPQFFSDYFYATADLIYGAQGLFDQERRILDTAFWLLIILAAWHLPKNVITNIKT